MKRTLTVCLFAILCVTASAQDTHMSTIETEGVGIVDTVSAQVQFYVTTLCTAPTTLEATDKVLEFEPALRDALKGGDLSPSEFVFSSTVVPGAHDSRSADSWTVLGSARLRFYAAPYVTGTEGPREFANLCDRLTVIAKGLQGTVQGPTLMADDPESVEQSAIVRATEQAYPAAKAIAGVMKGQILAVDHVSVQSVTWNTSPKDNDPQPELRKLVCTAKVRVIYAFAPTQP